MTGVMTFYNKNKKLKTLKNTRLSASLKAGDERIELPPKVLETPIIPFDQSPMLFSHNKKYYTRIDQFCQEKFCLLFWKINIWYCNIRITVHFFSKKFLYGIHGGIRIIHSQFLRDSIKSNRYYADTPC